MFGLVAHARHSSVKKPLSASRYQANRNVARINCPGNSITIFKSQPIPAIDPFDRKSEYDILVVKTVEAQTHNFLHYKFNDDVLNPQNQSSRVPSQRIARIKGWQLIV